MLTWQVGMAYDKRRIRNATISDYKILDVPSQLYNLTHHFVTGTTASDRTVSSDSLAGSALLVDSQGRRR